MNRLRNPVLAPVVIFATAVFLFLPMNTTTLADDWPQWRGENRDAVLSVSEQIESLPKKPEAKWSVEIGAGYSGPTVADGRVYITDRGPADIQTEVERILCFDAETGDQIWSHQYDSAYSIGYRAGPRASVTVRHGRAYAVGAMGHFHCLNAATGEIIWRRDLNTEYEIRMPIWGITAAPLIYDDMVIQILGGKGAACVVAMDWQDSSLDKPDVCSLDRFLRLV